MQPVNGASDLTASPLIQRDFHPNADTPSWQTTDIATVFSGSRGFQRSLLRGVRCGGRCIDGLATGLTEGWGHGHSRSRPLREQSSTVYSAHSEPSLTVDCYAERRCSVGLLPDRAGAERDTTRPSGARPCIGPARPRKRCVNASNGSVWLVWRLGPRTTASRKSMPPQRERRCSS